MSPAAVLQGGSVCWNSAACGRAPGASGIDKLPERQRPHYTPVQCFRILARKSLAGLSQPEAARLFCVSVHSIARWEIAANPASHTVGSNVCAIPPVHRYNDTVHHLVQALASLGSAAPQLGTTPRTRRMEDRQNHRGSLPA